MLGTSILPEIIRSAILSTRVESAGIMPVSIFLIAPFEQGKTRLAIENCGSESLILTDFSGMGLLFELRMNQKASTVVISDLSVAVAHKQHVNKLTISILNALAEEGSYKIAMPNMAHLDLGGRKVNIIACCVPEVVADRRAWWYKSGFMSRLLSVRFEQSISLQLAIHKAIKNSESEEAPHILRVPDISIKVELPDRQSEELSSLSTRVYEAYGETGYRKHKQLRALAAGHALLRTWKNPVVSQQDIDFIEKCIPFLMEGSKI